jgi:hypothetical protein
MMLQSVECCQKGYSSISLNSFLFHIHHSSLLQTKLQSPHRPSSSPYNLASTSACPLASGAAASTVFGATASSKVFINLQTSLKVL